MRINYQWFLHSVYSISQRYHISLAVVYNLCGIFNDTDSQWRIELSMEYRGDHGKHNRKPDIHVNVYRDWNQFNRLLHIRFYHGDRKSVAECYGHSFAINDLYRGVIYIDCEWRYLLSVEHGSDNSKYHGESGYDNNLFSNRN
jgi:hypothetical protein